MASRTVTQIFDEHLRPTGIRATQFPIVATARIYGPLSLTDMADRLAMDRTTLTRNLRPLERSGWVAIERATDRRRRMVALTSEGIERLGQAVPAWERAQADVREQLGPDLTDRLLGDLGTVAELKRTK